MNNLKKNRVTYKDLIFDSIKLGICSFYKGDFKIALKRIVLPINYWRVAIFKIVADFILNMNIYENDNIKILDVGSPKFLSIFLASKINADLYATDLQDESIFTEWKRYYKNSATKKNVIFEYANAKQLKYPDNYFDIIYSLSVIHMITPGNEGDILALKEIQKKIKPGGVLILEVPYRNQYAENYRDKSNFEETYNGKPLFKERQYDDNALGSRIIKNIDGRLIEKVILYEKIHFDSFWNKMPNPITMTLAFIEPWMDMINISIAKNEKQIKKGKSVILTFVVR